MFEASRPKSRVANMFRLWIGSDKPEKAVSDLIPGHVARKIEARRSPKRSLSKERETAEKEEAVVSQQAQPTSNVERPSASGEWLGAFVDQ